MYNSTRLPLKNYSQELSQGKKVYFITPSADSLTSSYLLTSTNVDTSNKQFNYAYSCWWQVYAKSYPNVQVYVDLEDVYSIEQVSFTSCSYSNVYPNDYNHYYQVPPFQTLIFISEDNIRYNYVDCIYSNLLDTDHKSYPNKTHFTLTSEKFRGYGRYVLFAFSVIRYLGLYQIKVFSGSGTANTVNYKNETPVLLSEINSYMTELMPLLIQNTSFINLCYNVKKSASLLSRRIDDQSMINSIYSQVNSGILSAKRNQTLKNINYLEGPPYSEIDLESFKSLATVYSSIFSCNSILLWQDDSWEYCSPSEVPCNMNQSILIKSDLMLNDTSSSSFIITSCSISDIEISITVNNFISEDVTVNSSDIVSLYRVVHSETCVGIYPDDVMIPIVETFILKPGVSQKIWVSFSSTSDLIQSGIYVSSIKVIAEDEHTLPIELVIWPIDFPSDISSKNLAWTNFYWPLVYSESLKYIKSNYINLIVYEVTDLFYYVDNNGNWTRWPDLSRLEDLIESNPNSFILLFIRYLKGWDFTQASQRNTFSQWVTYYRDFLLSKGYSRNNFAWYWFDEGSDQDWDTYIIPCAKQLKSVDNQMLTFCNSGTPSLDRLSYGIINRYIDIYCTPIQYTWGPGVTSVRVNNGGSGYSIGDLLDIRGSLQSCRAILRVDSINNGSVTGLSIVHAGRHANVQNNVGTYNLYGSGRNCTVDILGVGGRSTHYDLTLQTSFTSICYGVSAGWKLAKCVNAIFDFWYIYNTNLHGGGVWVQFDFEGVSDCIHKNSVGSVVINNPSSSISYYVNSDSMTNPPQIFDSKRIFAWKQGITDFEYLSMLKSQIESSISQGINLNLASEAQSILDNEVSQIIGDLYFDQFIKDNYQSYWSPYYLFDFKRTDYVNLIKSVRLKILNYLDQFIN